MEPVRANAGELLKQTYETKDSSQSIFQEYAHSSVEVDKSSDRNEQQSCLERQKTTDGEAHFHRLGWKRLTIVLIVESIALGSLSLPAAFASLGMVAGVISCIGVGLLAIYTSHIIGLVKLKFPKVSHYGDAIGLLLGKIGYEVASAMFTLQLVLLVGSHCLTGTIAFTHITGTNICSIVFGAISAILLLILAIPPTFTEMAILGYIDFASILLAIGITIIGTGIKANQSDQVSWSAWPKPGTGIVDGFLAISNVVFAYSFAMCEFSFLDEMHVPEDYIKAIWALGIAQIVIYTLTGSLIYAFIGIGVKSPALLSAGGTLSKVAFGVALPVIFISGAINSTVLCRYLHGRLFKNSITRYVNTPRGWVTWLGLVTIVTILAFITAESIPVFYDLLAICGSLFVSGFSFYIPAVMWYRLLREGSWYSRKNLADAVMCAVCFVVGVVILCFGTYASIVDMVYHPLFQSAKIFAFTKQISRETTSIREQSENLLLAKSLVKVPVPRARKI